MSEEQKPAEENNAPAKANALESSQGNQESIMPVAPPPLPTVPSDQLKNASVTAEDGLLVKVASAIGTTPHGSKAVTEELATTRHKNKRTFEL